MVKPKTDDQPPIPKRTPGQRTPTTANFDSIRRRMQEQNPHTVLFNLPTSLPAEVHQNEAEESTSTGSVAVHQNTTGIRANAPTSEVHQAEQWQSTSRDTAGVHQQTKQTSTNQDAVEVYDSKPVEVATVPVEGKPATRIELVEVLPSTNEAVAVHQRVAVDSRKGDRHASDRVKFSGRFDPVIYKQIKVYCAQNSIDVRDYFETVAVHHLRAVEAHQDFLVEGKAAHDDLKISKTNEDIITIYKQLTSNK